MKNDLYAFFVNRILEKKQQIDVGFRMDGSAAVAADGEDRKRFLDRPVPPHLPDDLVDLCADRILDKSRLWGVQKPIFQVVNVGFKLGTADHQDNSAGYVITQP